MDVKFDFLNGFLEEKVYVEQPMGYMVKGHEDKVLKVKMALFDLKQASRVWNNRIDRYFLEHEFIKCPHEYAIYSKFHENGNVMFVRLYVDLIFTGSNPSTFEEFKRKMTQEFEMTIFGRVILSWYWGK